MNGLCKKAPQSQSKTRVLKDLCSFCSSPCEPTTCEFKQKKSLFCMLCFLFFCPFLLGRCRSAWMDDLEHGSATKDESPPAGNCQEGFDSEDYHILENMIEYSELHT